MSRAHQLPVILTPDTEDGGFTAVCPVIPGCISDGDTVDEALANIREAIDLCLESQADEGWVLPESVRVETVEIITAA